MQIWHTCVTLPAKLAFISFRPNKMSDLFSFLSVLFAYFILLTIKFAHHLQTTDVTFGGAG